MITKRVTGRSFNTLQSPALTDDAKLGCRKELVKANVVERNNNGSDLFEGILNIYKHIRVWNLELRTVQI